MITASGAGDAAEVSEVHAPFSFKAEAGKASELLCTLLLLF
jgi:hypothetical protein